MRQFIAAILLLLSAAAMLLLSGCPGYPNAGPAGENNAPPPEIRSENIFSTVSDTDGSSLYLCAVKLTAISADGGTLWEYTTPDCYVREPGTAQYIGTCGDVVLLNESALYDSDNRGAAYDTHRLRALDAYTGAVMWDNSEFSGAGADCAYDDGNGVFYLCGYNGPDCFAVNAKGRTMWITDHVGGGTRHARGIELDGENGRIRITYDETGEDGIYGYIDRDGDKRGYTG